jgi:5,10-methenyltetrahydrofolate synthetase
MKSKSELRQQIKKQLAAMGMTQPSVSQGLLRNLRNFQELWAVRTLAGFLAIGHEPDLSPLFQDWLSDGRCLLLPRYNSISRCYELAEVADLERDTLKGHYGILEPAPLLSKVILSSHLPAAWLVPGLAFSQDGSRLGRGAGYYDRLLGASTSLKIGVCRDCQLVPEIPVQLHDVQMHYIITETRIIKCQQKAEEFAL